MEETPPLLYVNRNSQFNFTTESYFMERGLNYEAYSKIRESRLRLRSMIRVEEYPDPEIPKPGFSPSLGKKTVKFQVENGFTGQNRNPSKPTSSSSSSSMMAQSVPDLMSAIRKENRRPPTGNRMEKSATPPPTKSSRLYGSGSKTGSKSVNSREKKAVGRLMVGARKSYASIEELKGLSAAAALAISGENRSGQKRVIGKTSVLGIRQSVQFY